jgi:hypothetical protein
MLLYACYLYWFHVSCNPETNSALVGITARKGPHGGIRHGLVPEGQIFRADFSQCAVSSRCLVAGTSQE